MSKLFCLVTLMTLLTFSARAEDINLTADEKVEWHQNEQKIVAVGNAVASKKDLSVRADKMTAFYKENPNGGDNKTSIDVVYAAGNVKMHSPKADAFGETLDYDLTADKMVLRGRPAKIKTDQDTITAEDSITYYPGSQKAVANGNVVGVSKDNKVYADQMISYFEKNAAGQMEMKRVEIFGHVKISTPKADVTAEKGLYLPQTGIVKLFNNVEITQNGNILKGDYAETDLNTGISRLVSQKSNRGRVTGVFKEKSKSDEKK